MCGEERNPARNRALKTLRQGLQRCGCVWLTVSLTVLKTLRGCTTAAVERWLSVLETFRCCREMANTFGDPQGL